MTRDITVLISEFGTSVRKRGARFLISRGADNIEEVAASRAERIILPVRGASISTDAIALAIERDVPVYFSYYNGRPLAYLMPAKGKEMAKIRRAQYTASSRTRASLVKGFVTGKIQNQQAFLQKKIRNRRNTLASSKEQYMLVLDQLARVVEAINTLADNKETLVSDAMVLEAHAASKYWMSIGTIIPERYKFPGRKKRGASDAVNRLLNYGYGILRNEVWSAITYAGLDPFGGFLHADKSSRPSLVFDLMEEFRAPIVDSVVIRLLCEKNMPLRRITEENGLSQWARTQLIQAIAECLSSPVKYQGKSVRMSVVIAKQAEQVAHVLRDRNRRYEPFLRRW